jgi:hypothetical protein
MVPKADNKLCGDVLRVGGASAIAEQDDFSPSAKGAGDALAQRRDVRDKLRRETLFYPAAFRQLGADEWLRGLDGRGFQQRTTFSWLREIPRVALRVSTTRDAASTICWKS